VSSALAGLVVALPEECRSLTNRRVRRGDCFALGEGRLVCVSGVGKDNAAQAAHRLIDAGARGLLSWGCAGGLSPTLKPGDLCLPSAILDALGQSWSVSALWHHYAREALHPVFDPDIGPLVTADRAAATADDKRALAISSGAVAIDMESAAVAAVARERALPFLAVRAIADPADMALPPLVLRATDANGSFNRPLLIAQTLLNLGQMAAMLRLASHFRVALRTLTEAARLLEGALRLDADGALGIKACRR
jgi:adenosylhomocysteine nucleosidase